MINIEEYRKTSNHNCLYYITKINNVVSILKHGLLSHNSASAYNHSDFSMSDVQEKRKNKIVYGHSVHEYVNLYINPYNPTLYRVCLNNEEICILKIDLGVMKKSNVVVSDMNMACTYVKYSKIENYSTVVDFTKTNEKYWVKNGETDRDIKNRKCAEVLIPKTIESEYRAIVENVNDREKLIEVGFDKEIEIRRFF